MNDDWRVTRRHSASVSPEEKRFLKAGMHMLFPAADARTDGDAFTPLLRAIDQAARGR
jgi:hypothetical protein